MRLYSTEMGVWLAISKIGKNATLLQLMQIRAAFILLKLVADAYSGHGVGTVEKVDVGVRLGI